tara:strand:+ start:392 stop:571 length:180 start_codon:yes stop_codon:yes gene_type:complete
MALSKIALLALAVGARAADDQVVVGQTFIAVHKSKVVAARSPPCCRPDPQFTSQLSASQ